MFGSLDAIIATAAIVLGLSLIVQAMQQIIKQWLDLKSNYMRLQLLAMFDQTSTAKESKMAGLMSVRSLSDHASEEAKSMVQAIETMFQSFGYKNLEHLEHLDADKFKDIVGSLNWDRLPGVKEGRVTLHKITRDIDVWFDLAKKAYQDLYERRMKVWSFALSVIIVLSVDANLFKIYSEFTVNTPLREAAVAWAEKSAQTESDQTTSPSDSGAIRANDAQRVALIRVEIDSIKTILGSDAFQVLGWKPRPYKAIGSEGWFWNWLMGVLGLMGMSFLVSLGAPFWYDLLKTITGVKDRLRGGGSGSQPNMSATGAAAPVNPLPDTEPPAVG